jgi:hypothetical protein
MIASMMKSQEDGSQSGDTPEILQEAPRMGLRLHQNDRGQRSSDSEKDEDLQLNALEALEWWSAIHPNFTTPPYMVLLHTPIPPSLLATLEVVNRIHTQRVVNCFYYSLFVDEYAISISWLPRIGVIVCIRPRSRYHLCQSNVIFSSPSDCQQHSAAVPAARSHEREQKGYSNHSRE